MKKIICIAAMLAVALTLFIVPVSAMSEHNAMAKTSTAARDAVQATEYNYVFSPYDDNRYSDYWDDYYDNYYNWDDENGNHATNPQNSYNAIKGIAVILFFVCLFGGLLLLAAIIVIVVLLVRGSNKKKMPMQDFEIRTGPDGRQYYYPKAPGAVPPYTNYRPTAQPPVPPVRQATPQPPVQDNTAQSPQEKTDTDHTTRI